MLYITNPYWYLESLDCIPSTDKVTIKRLILLYTDKINNWYSVLRNIAEIVDGNLKMTLGMIWTIILRFAIQDISVEGRCVCVFTLSLQV